MDLLDALSPLRPFSGQEEYKRACNAVMKTYRDHGANHAFRHAENIADAFVDVTLVRRLRG